MQNGKIKFITQSLFTAILIFSLVRSFALAAQYSSFNDCLSNIGTNDPETSCCALPASNFNAPATQSTACSSGSASGTNLIEGSPCISNQVCASGNCSSGVCALAGTSASSNLNGNSTSNSGSGSICDTQSGNYELLPSGLCVPKSPFNTGLASQSSLSGLITTILNIILALSGIIAVIFIIIGGFQYMTAGGNSEQAEKGRAALTNAIIGLLIVILAFTIVQVVTNALTTANPLTK